MDWFLYDNSLRHERVNEVNARWKTAQDGRAFIAFPIFPPIGARI